jgi:aspartyl/glutamyl-tRNA(Asn/Gln) amidotransferase C subunit
MTEKIDIRALAGLARLDISDDEVARLGTEIPGILAFVETIQKVAADASPAQPARRNVMRADENPHESGAYTETLLAAAPARVGDKVAVKQVISKKK